MQPLFAALLAASLLAGPALAQEADWDLSANPSQGVTTASVEFGEGVLLAIQCQNRQLSVIIGGIPGPDEPTRSVSITRGDGQSHNTVLAAVEGSALFRSRSPHMARFLRGGGQTAVASRPEDPRPFRMVLDLPRQSAAVANVLTACGYALAEDRETLPDISDQLTRLPRIQMPPFSRDYTIVSVELSCLVAEGRLAHCRSDRETPAAPEIGAATARLADGVRLSLKDQAQADGGVLEIVVTGNRIRR